QDRGLKDTSGAHVWAFLGDGECDEPETLGAITLAGREKLDNLIFVVNCNLQRLDGPVRGNGKIIQELEGIFRGAGWNVIKVIWGDSWDPLLAKDKDGLLVKRLGEVVEGRNTTHNQKKLEEKSLVEFRSRFGIPISDEDVAKAPFYKPPADSEEMKYLQARRKELGGYVPTRVDKPVRSETPKLA